MTKEVNLTTTPKYFTPIMYQEGSGRNRVVKRQGTKSQAKFTRILNLINSQIDCYLRVSYVGNGWNDGYYTNRDELMLAYKAFVER